jgi:nitroimidazol reductase NimA-like FMN-containing flavoprotein (pyridoxamine 5'-phosphate oxidase superfamily)
MQYKTIILELLRQSPEVCIELSKNRMLLRTMNVYAAALKARHTAWMDVLRPARPESEESQVSNEALRLAVEDLRPSLLREASTDATEELSLDAAMAFICRHTPH